MLITLGSQMVKGSDGMSLFFSFVTEDTPPVEFVSVLYTVIPCLLFAILFASVVIFVCWRCRKQIMHQAEQSAAIPLVPVVGKPVVSHPNLISYPDLTLSLEM